MIILDGKEVSKALRKEIKEKTLTFEKRHNHKPGLGVILVGEDPASEVYVRNKEKACAEVGFYSKKVVLPANSTQGQVIEAINLMNQDSKIDGFLVQLPLPKGLNTEFILDHIDPKKDADGLHPMNLGLLWVGRKRVAPCTPWGVMRILKHYQISVEGKNVVVIGRSQIVGKPMAYLLSESNATVTICHSKTKNLKEVSSHADIVVVAAGQREMFGKDYFKKDAVVIDVGIHGSGQGMPISGDVRYKELEGWASAATPVPGGVGPMTISCLLENTLTLAEIQKGK